MTIRGSFHVRSERLDPLSQTGFSMASTCVWRCIASPLFPSRKRIFYTHPHARTITCTLGRVCSLDTRVHTWARYPISYCTETPHWGREREREKGSDKERRAFKALAPLSPRLSFRSWLKQPQRFSSGKTRCERWNKTWSGFRREFDDWQCAANVDNERRALWKMYIAKWFSPVNDNIQGDQWLGIIVRQTSHINWGIFNV